MFEAHKQIVESLTLEALLELQIVIAEEIQKKYSKERFQRNDTEWQRRKNVEEWNRRNAETNKPGNINTVNPDRSESGFDHKQIQEHYIEDMGGG